MRLIHEYLWYAFDKGELPMSQKRGIIILLPKKGNPTDTLNNLHPVSLLNTNYKIASKALAKRVEKVLPEVIHENQTGYVKKICIHVGENVRFFKHVMDFTNVKKLPGIVV